MISHIARAAAALAALGAFATAAAVGACGEGTEGSILSAVPTDAAVAPTDASVALNASLTFVADGGSTEQHGGDGGSEHVDVCPDDQVVVGYDGYVTGADGGVGLDIVGALRAVCGAPSVVDAHLVVAPGATLATWGLHFDEAWSQACPADMVVVGVSGGAGVALDRLALACAPWTAVRGDAGPELVRGPITVLPASGGDGGVDFDLPCPDGEMARGDDLRSGEWIDAFGLVCARPTLVAH